jgi:lysophospholipase L1-like esterase
VKLWPPKLWKATRITVETQQIVIISRRRITRSWCSQCAAESEFIPVEVVNQVLGGGPGQGRQLPLGDGFHFSKAGDGAAVVCVRSLKERI